MTTEPHYPVSTQFDGVASTLLNDPGDQAEVVAALKELLPQALSTAIGNARPSATREQD